MQIESAKEQWALDNHKKQGAKVTLHYLVGATLYIKAKPTCLKGGLYLINRVGDNPTCMHEGHVLPQ